MKYFDCFIQTLLFIAALMALVFSYPSHTMCVESILTCQFYLGLWQVGSAIASVILQTQLRKLKNIYLLMVVGYFMAMGILYRLQPETEFIWIVSGMIVPWLYATWYYIISLQALRTQDISGKGFLPHTSF